MNCFLGWQHLNWNSAEEDIVLANPGGGGKFRGKAYEDIVMSLKQEQEKS